jgi:hypothetical protein
LNGHAEIARFKDLDDLLLALLGRHRELDPAFRDAGLSGCSQCLSEELLNHTNLL